MYLWFRNWRCSAALSRLRAAGALIIGDARCWAVTIDDHFVGKFDASLGNDLLRLGTVTMLLYNVDDGQIAKIAPTLAALHISRLTVQSQRVSDECIPSLTLLKNVYWIDASRTKITAKGADILVAKLDISRVVPSKL